MNHTNKERFDNLVRGRGSPASQYATARSLSDDDLAFAISRGSNKVAKAELERRRIAIARRSVEKSWADTPLGRFALPVMSGLVLAMALIVLNLT